MIITRKTHRENPKLQISVKFFKNGSTATSFQVFSKPLGEMPISLESIPEKVYAFLKKTPLIDGGEKRDQNGIVREIRVGKYDPSTKNYSLSEILLNWTYYTIFYRVRHSPYSFTRFDHYYYRFINSETFFSPNWELHDPPIGATITSEHELDEPKKKHRSPKTTLRNRLSKFDAYLFDSFTDIRGFTPGRSMSLINSKNRIVWEVLSFNLEPKLLRGAILTKIFGKNGKTLTYWSAKGGWKNEIIYENGEFSVLDNNLDPGVAGNLIGFLNHYFPNNVNGVPYPNLENDLDAVTRELKGKPLNYEIEVIPSLMFQ